jgi:cell division septation protein DedD
MTAYEKIKNWLEEKENKNKLVLGLSFIIVFAVGFGAGSYAKHTSYKPQANYTTIPSKKPVTTKAPAADTGEVLGKATTAVAATSTQPSACVVKGNIASTGKKIYHVKGGAFYNRVKPEECFNTEAEALAAGFIKSSR